MNNLTGLIPTIYTALNQVSRELIGFIPNVSVDAKASSAAVGQTVRVPVAGQSTLEDITPGDNPNDSGDTTTTYSDVVITKSKAYPIRWTGEEQLSIGPKGEYNTILADQFAEGFRTLSNEVETDLGGLYTRVARAVGTAGTTPFGTKDNHIDFANANRMLDELGVPQSGRVMVLGSAARANVEGIQSGLFKVNEAGDDGRMLRNREQRQIHGFTMGYSAGVRSHSKGTANGYLINNGAGELVGETTLSLDTGNGTMLVGDILTHASDSENKYVIGSELAAGDVVINSPGLAIEANDDDVVTVGDNYTANMVFHRSSLVLAARAPAMPEGGDEAADVMNITDPFSGLTFQVAMYRQYRRIKYEIGLAWGVAAPNGKHGGILLG